MGSIEVHDDGAAWFWVGEQNFDVVEAAKNPDTPAHVLELIIENAPFAVMLDVIQHRNLPRRSFDLFAVEYDTYNIVDNDTFRDAAISTPHCTGEVLERTYYALISENLRSKVLLHPNFPHILLDLIIKNVTANGTDYKAFLNPSLPVSEVFMYLGNVKDVAEYNIIHTARIGELVKFCENKFGVNVSDWPYDWVVELLKQQNLSILH